MPVSIDESPGKRRHFPFIAAPAVVTSPSPCLWPGGPFSRLALTSRCVRSPLNCQPCCQPNLLEGGYFCSREHTSARENNHRDYG